MIRNVKYWIICWWILIRDSIRNLQWTVYMNDPYIRQGWFDAYYGIPYGRGHLTPRQAKKYQIGWEKGKKDLQEDHK